MEVIRLEIITPNGSIFEDDVKSVTVPGKEGEFGILPGHASLVSLLSPGVIDIERKDENFEAVAIDWGHVKVDETKVTVLVDGAVAIVGKTESQIAKALEAAEKLLKDASDSEIVGMPAIMSKLEERARVI
jgi:F-type H+-transporting ATPase subunit epsilon